MMRHSLSNELGFFRSLVTQSRVHLVEWDFLFFNRLSRRRRNCVGPSRRVGYAAAHLPENVK